MQHDEQTHAEEYDLPHLPDPSIWPIVIAFGISVVLLGLAINLGLMLFGLLVLFAGIGGWIYQDIRIAQRDVHH